MEMKAHAYSPSSCGKSDEKPSLIHTRPSRRDGWPGDGYRLFRLSAGWSGEGCAEPKWSLKGANVEHAKKFLKVILKGMKFLNVQLKARPLLAPLIEFLSSFPNEILLRSAKVWREPKSEKGGNSVTPARSVQLFLFHF